MYLPFCKDFNREMLNESAEIHKLSGENILLVDHTDVLNPSIRLQNQEMITTNFTSFILRNILSFNILIIST